MKGSDGMKHLQLKILITAIVILISVVVIRLFVFDNTTDDEGSIHLIITGIDDEILFDGDLSYQEGDHFYTILDRHFDLTCATATYQPDDDCSYNFNSILYQGKVILGIKGETFDLMTNWSDTFLSFYYFVGEEKKLATVGPSNIAFKDGDKFMISYQQAWE